MPFFPCAHAGHPLWQHAVKQVIVQLRAQISMQQLEAHTHLGVVYVSASYAEHARDILDMLSRALPEVQQWVGCATHAVLAGDMDYGHSGALAVMLPYVKAQDYQVFSGMTPWRSTDFSPHAALIHGDAASPKVAYQIQALQQQLGGAVLTGGACDLQNYHAQWSWGAKAMTAMPLSIGGGGVQKGGFSGVAFAANVECMSVGMQGCKPIGRALTITQAEGDVVLELDGKPALTAFFGEVDWGKVLGQKNPNTDAIWKKVEQSLMAMLPPDEPINTECLSTHARVMRVAGVDPLRQGIVLEGIPVQGCRLTLCQPDEQAMRAEMRRACAELWESLTAAVAHSPAEADIAAPHGRCICGAIYIRNQHRNPMVRSPHIDAELQLIRHALGPIPLLGFTSSYEIDAGQLQCMSAQLLVFTQPLQALT